MSNQIHVATRKGLFTLSRSANGWGIERTAFLGENLPMVLRDPRDGSVYAAFNLGHFGAKVRKSTDGVATWTEITPPKFPIKPDGTPDVFCPMARSRSRGTSR